MSGQVFPAELNQPLPRAVRLSGNMKMLWILLGSLLSLPLIFITVMMGSSIHNTNVLIKSGVTVEGKCTALIAHNGKNGINYKADYEFTPNGATSPVKISDQPVAAEIAGTFSAGSRVPVVYDPADPDNAQLNPSDRIHGPEVAERMHDDMFMLPVFFVLFGSIFLSLFWKYRKEKKLLQFGFVASGSIIKEEEYSGGKAGPLLRITYQFTAENGHTYEGVRDGLPRRDRAGKANQELLSKLFGNTVVLYNPQHPKRSMLYPGVYVECYLPQTSIK